MKLVKILLLLSLIVSCDVKDEDDDENDRFQGYEFVESETLSKEETDHLKLFCYSLGRKNLSHQIVKRVRLKTHSCSGQTSEKVETVANIGSDFIIHRNGRPYRDIFYPFRSLVSRNTPSEIKEICDNVEAGRDVLRFYNFELADTLFRTSVFEESSECYYNKIVPGGEKGLCVIFETLQRSDQEKPFFDKLIDKRSYVVFASTDNYRGLLKYRMSLESSCSNAGQKEVLEETYLGE